MNRQQNAERINSQYEFQAWTDPDDPGDHRVSTELRFVGVARRESARRGGDGFRWVPAVTEAAAFAALEVLAFDGEWMPEVVYDLDTGEMITLEVEPPPPPPPPRVTRSGDAVEYPNPCAVHVFASHLPQTTDGWIALGFDEAEAEELLNEPKPTLGSGCDRYSVEWIVDGWVILPI